MANKKKKTKWKNSFNVIGLVFFVFALGISAYALKTSSYFSFKPKASELVVDRDRYPWPINRDACMRYCKEDNNCGQGFTCTQDPLNPGGAKVCSKVGYEGDIFCGHANHCEIAVDPNIEFIPNSSEGCYKDAKFKCSPTDRLHTFSAGFDYSKACFSKSYLMAEIFRACILNGWHTAADTEISCYRKLRPTPTRVPIDLPIEPTYSPY